MNDRMDPSLRIEVLTENVEQKVYYSNIQEVSELVRQRQLSPVELVEICLRRAPEHNSRINAFITIAFDQAREQARVAENEIKAGQWRGPLHGIPIGIKDFYDTAGIKTTAAFQPFQNRVPAKDANSVAKLKEAGAIILGKMNMHEMGMGTTGLESAFGPVLNPWNADYIAGGSSSGSAAAVTAGLCYATIDTDAIGSCRLPAACCGVLGFKGTYGLISPQGILVGEEPPDEMILWLNHLGITTRSVHDTALILEVLAEQNEWGKETTWIEQLTQQRSLRIGVVSNFKADQNVSKAFETSVEIIRRFGHTMGDVVIPLRDPSSGLDNIEAGRKTMADQLFKDVDVIMLPTTTTTVPTIKEVESNPQGLSPENTVFANYYGLPAISVPCGFDTNGLPLGLQFAGKPWDDVTVLSLAYQFQITTDYIKKHPVP
jgi:aspartyl-tRNA(Asn)/glutamyl-tRNA(Gln) amidotransferase subunit A